MVLDLKRFIKLSLLFLVLFFFSACGGGGSSDDTSFVEIGPSSDVSVESTNLFHNVSSPFIDLLGESGVIYPSGEIKAPTLATGIDLEYKNFVENYDGVTDEIQERPFCKIGGKYKYKIYNDAGVGGIYENNEVFFDCKTTEDLINLAKIPVSWSSSNLVLYCNDGFDINFANLNLDFVTTFLNVYKVCSLKNLDLTANNTIVFGFEVGNSDVDKDFNFYNNITNYVSGSYPVLIGINYSEIPVEVDDDSVYQEVVDYVDVDYANVCTEEDVDGDNGDSTEITCVDVVKSNLDGAKDVAIQYVDRGLFSSYVYNGDYTFYLPYVKDDICPDYLDPPMRTVSGGREEEDVQVVDYRPYNDLNEWIDGNCPNYNSYITNPSNDYFSIELVDSSDLSKKSVYKVITHKSINVTKSMYSDINGPNEYDFHYDPLNNFFSLDNTGEDIYSSSVDLVSTFTIPNDFDLSRVALFRQIAPDRKIYGYENIEKFAVADGTSSYPVYKISFDSSFDDENIGGLCMKSLASYSPIEKNNAITAPISDFHSKIACGNDYMMLNSKAFNDDADLGLATSFNLFKNIILGLKNGEN